MRSVTEQLYVNKDIFICIPVTMGKITTAGLFSLPVMASPWCMSEAAMWTQTAPQRSSSPAYSSFPSGPSQLRGSSHLLIPLIQKKKEKTMHEFEGEAGLLWSLLVIERARESQCKPSKGPSHWNRWHGQCCLSRQP